MWRTVGRKAAPLHFFHDDIKCVPDWVVTPNVTRGYRPQGGSPVDLAMTAFKMHNDTVNVWSHLLPALMFFALAFQEYNFAPHWRTEKDRLAMLLFLLTAAGCMGCSAVFHLMGCFSKRMFDALRCLDQLGIVSLIAGSYSPVVWFTLQCIPRWVMMYSVAVLVTWSISVALVLAPSTPRVEMLRQAAFAFNTSWGVLVIAHGVAMATPQPQTTVLVTGSAVTLALYTLGFSLYLTGWPEAKWPGRVNLIGHSHQLFHVCVALAVATWYLTMSSVYSSTPSNTCELMAGMGDGSLLEISMRGMAGQ